MRWAGLLPKDAVRLFITMIHTDTRIQPFRSLLLVVASGFRSRGEYSHDLAFDIDDHPLPKVGSILPRAPFFSLMSRFRLAREASLTRNKREKLSRGVNRDAIDYRATKRPLSRNVELCLR
jgi:hypothetical protein